MSGGTRDLGFAAEEVAVPEPLSATRNGRGEVGGAKYDQPTAAAVNAAREQRRQSESQQRQIRNQNVRLAKRQRDIDGLKRAVRTLSARRRCKSGRRLCGHEL